MTIPFGFGKGCIGRVLMKYTTEQLEKELKLEPRSGCGYEIFALQIHKWMVELILKHRHQ
jgi:hypothetical protein